MGLNFPQNIENCRSQNSFSPRNGPRKVTIDEIKFVGKRFSRIQNFVFEVFFFFFFAPNSKLPKRKMTVLGQCTAPDSGGKGSQVVKYANSTDPTPL